MRDVACFIAWEWINISLEYAASSWVRLPRWLLSVVAVNLVTHPVFVLALDAFGQSATFVLSCETAIVCIEALLLMAVYGFCRWCMLLCTALVMNAASYCTGLLIYK